MPRSGLLLVLLVLLVSAAELQAVHDNGFCSITPNTGVRLPEAPKIFYMTVTTEEAGGILTALDYFNDELKKSAFFIGTSDSSFRVLVDHVTKQAQIVQMGSRAIPGNCQVQEIQDNQLLVGVDIFPGVRTTIPSKSLFFGLGDEGLVNQGNVTINNNLLVTKFYSCYYLSSFDVSMQIMWYFRDVGTAYVTPVRIELIKQYNSNGKRQERSTLEISNFRNRAPSWTARTNPFQAPPGVFCRGLKSTRQPPPLPERFSIRMEEVVSNVTEPVYLREAYDFRANLSMLERTPPPSEAVSKYGAGKLLYLHDFKFGHAFIINKDIGNCTYERLTGSEWDAGQDFATIRLRSPREYFDMEGAEIQYKGTGPLRGIPSDVYIGFKKLASTEVPGLTFNTTLEWYFVNKTMHDVVSNTKKIVAIPGAIKTTSDAPWLNAWLYVFDFDSRDMHFNRHDISNCFTRDRRSHFLVYFPLKNPNLGKYIRERPTEFMSFILPLISGSIKFSHLRIYDPEVSSNADTAIVEFSVTDAPENSEDLPLESIEPSLRRLVDSGNLIGVLTDDNNNLLSVTASKVDTVLERSKNLKSIGYSAGGLIGIAFAMAIIGVSVGVGLIFAIYKFRGSSLLGIDPFKPQRIV